MPQHGRSTRWRSTRCTCNSAWRFMGKAASKMRTQHVAMRGLPTQGPQHRLLRDEPLLAQGVPALSQIRPARVVSATDMLQGTFSSCMRVLGSIDENIATSRLMDDTIHTSMTMCLCDEVPLCMVAMRAQR